MRLDTVVPKSFTFSLLPTDSVILDHVVFYLLVISGILENTKEQNANDCFEKVKFTT
jgi:hypothetical protein